MRRKRGPDWLDDAKARSAQLAQVRAATVAGESDLVPELLRLYTACMKDHQFALEMLEMAREEMPHHDGCRKFEEFAEKLERGPETQP